MDMTGGMADSRDEEGCPGRTARAGFARRSLLRLLGAERERLGDHAVDVALLHVAPEILGTRAAGLEHDIVDGVHAGVAAGRDVALAAALTR